MDKLHKITSYYLSGNYVTAFNNLHSAFSYATWWKKAGHHESVGYGNTEYWEPTLNFPSEEFEVWKKEMTDMVSKDILIKCKDGLSLDCVKILQIAVKLKRPFDT